ncbi:UNVERIFIED_CONTAM: hypothetical protein FKN15_019267 [Acipenser sinensis]
MNSILVIRTEHLSKESFHFTFKAGSGSIATAATIFVSCLLKYDWLELAQPAGVPEILKKSLHSCSVMGGEEVFLIGKNFLKGTKVIFQENVSANIVEVSVKKEVPSPAQSCSFEESTKGMKTQSCTMDKASLLPSALMTKNEEVTPMEVSSNQTARNVFKTSDVIGSAQQTLDMSLNISLSSIPFSNSVSHQLGEPEQHQQIQSTSFSSIEPLSTIQKQDIAPTSPLLQQVTQQYQRPDLLLDHIDALSQERVPDGESVMEMQQLGKTSQQQQQSIEQQQPIQQQTMQQQQPIQQQTMQQQQPIQQQTMQQQQPIQQQTMQQQQPIQQQTMQQQQPIQQQTMQQQQPIQQQTMQQQQPIQQQTMQQQQPIQQQTMQQQQPIQQQTMQQQQPIQQQTMQQQQPIQQQTMQQQQPIQQQTMQQQQPIQQQTMQQQQPIQQQTMQQQQPIQQQTMQQQQPIQQQTMQQQQPIQQQTMQQQQPIQQQTMQQQQSYDWPDTHAGGSVNENLQQQLTPQGLFQPQSTGAPSEDGGSQPKQMQTSVFQNMVQTQGQVGTLFQTPESMIHSGSQQQGSLFQQAEEMLSIQVPGFLQQPPSHPSPPQLFHSQGPMSDTQDPPTTLFQNQKHSPTQEQVQAAMFQSSLTVLTNSPLQPDQQQHGSGLFLSQNNVTTLQSGQIAQDSKQQQQQQQLAFLTSLQSSGSTEQQSVSVFQPQDKSSLLQESTPMDQQPQQDAVFQTMPSSANGLLPSQQGAFFQSQHSMGSSQEQQQQAGLLLFSGRNQMQQLNSSLPPQKPQNQAMFLTQSNLVSVSPQEQSQPMSFQNQSSVAGGTPQNEQPQQALFHNPQQMQLVQGSSSASESHVTNFMPQASLPSLQGSVSQQELPQATIFSSQSSIPSPVQPQGVLFHTAATRTMNQPGQPQQTSGLFLFGIQNADCGQLITSGDSTLSDQLIAISQSGQNQREKEASIQSLLTQTISELGTIPNAMTASQNMEKIDDLLVSLQDQSNMTRSF